MLEVRYNTITKEVTGWWGNRHGNHEVKLRNRPNEAMAMIDIPIPDKGLDAWLYDEATQSLMPNPDYIESEPPRDLAAELDILVARMDASIGAALTVSETEVFSGTSPTSFTDLNLSGTIGSNAALVLIKVYSASSFLALAVRKNGDTDEFYGAASKSVGCAIADDALAGSYYAVLLVTTDTSGVIEWRTGIAETTTIDIIAYIK